MTFETEAISRARVVRKRLMNPPNAVPDTGINLKQTRPDILCRQLGIVYIPPEPKKPTPAPKSPPIPASLKPLVLSSPPTVSDIIQIVARFHHMTAELLLSTNRTSHIVKARHITMYLARKHTKASFPKIGRRLGGRDHSTLHYGVRKIVKLMETDQELCVVIQKIEEEIKA